MTGLRWHLWPFMLERGWTRPADLANASGISKPAAKALLADDQQPVEKLHMPTVYAVANVFGCLDEPWTLFEYTPPDLLRYEP